MLVTLCISLLVVYSQAFKTVFNDKLMIRPRVISQKLSLKRGNRISSGNDLIALEENLLESKNDRDSKNDNNNNNVNEPGALNLLVLASVPLAWGSYSPLVKSLYTTAELPPPGIIFNAISYAVSVCTLGSLAFITKDGRKKRDISDEEAKNEENEKQRMTLIGGIQLGTLLFLGSNVQVLGIQSTSASKAGILVQLTTVIVPILEGIISKKALGTHLWIASTMALLGVVCVSIDDPSEFIRMLSQWMSDGINMITHLSSNSGSSSSSSSSIDSVIVDQVTSLTADATSLFSSSFLGNGELLLCLSAFFYSLHVLLLGQYASQVDSIQLARNKAITELTLSVLVMGIALPINGGDNEIMNYTDALLGNSASVGIPLLLLTCFWNGAVTTAYTMWAQTYGQQTMSPTRANLVYSSQPVWSAIFSMFLLHETLDAQDAIGCLVLLIAVFISQVKFDKINSSDETEVGVES